MDGERAAPPRFSPAAGSIHGLRDIAVQWCRLPVGIGCSLYRRSNPVEIEKRQRDDVPWSPGDPARARRNPVNQSRWKAPVVRNRKHSKDGRSRPTCRSGTGAAMGFGANHRYRVTEYLGRVNYLQLNGLQTPDIDLLAAELLHPSGETQIAIAADGERYVARLVKQSLAELPAQRLLVRGDASYLVTGGLGMLGRCVAEWLISKGAKHIVLTGRNASSEAAKKLFSATETNGAIIHAVAADISRDEDVSRLMQTVGNELPPLKGVVHSAGLLDDGILAQLNWDRFAPLFEPRVYGSWLLHEHTKSLGLISLFCSRPC